MARGSAKRSCGGQHDIHRGFGERWENRKGIGMAEEGIAGPKEGGIEGCRADATSIAMAERNRLGGDTVDAFVFLYGSHGFACCAGLDLGTMRS